MRVHFTETQHNFCSPRWGKKNTSTAASLDILVCKPAFCDLSAKNTFLIARPFLCRVNDMMEHHTLRPVPYISRGPASNSRFHSAAQQHSVVGQPQRQAKQLLSTLLPRVLLFKILHEQALKCSSPPDSVQRQTRIDTPAFQTLQAPTRMHAQNPRRVGKLVGVVLVWY